MITDLLLAQEILVYENSRFIKRFPVKLLNFWKASFLYHLSYVQRCPGLFLYLNVQASTNIK